MSNHHVNWVLQYSGTKGIDRMVLLVLANYANPGDNRCAPSMTTLCRLSAADRPEVEAALLRLREAGLIEVDDAGAKPSFMIKGGRG